MTAKNGKKVFAIRFIAYNPKDMNGDLVESFQTILASSEVEAMRLLAGQYEILSFEEIINKGFIN